jgi:hypothetical protein
MPHVMPHDRAALAAWAARTGRDLGSDPSYVHESTWAEHLRDRIADADDRFETTAPDADWKARWTTAALNPLAWRKGAPGRDDALALHARLVAIGGWAACMRDVRLAPVLLAEGAIVDGAGAEMRIGRPCDCHENSAKLVRQDPSLVAHYGYALSDDGMWREHSWCVRPDGGIVETTVARVAYYGTPDRT